MTSTPTINARCLLQCNPAQLVLDNLRNPGTLRRLEQFASQLQHYLELANRDLAQQQRSHEADPDGFTLDPQPSEDILNEGLSGQNSSHHRTRDEREDLVQDQISGEPYADRVTSTVSLDVPVVQPKQEEEDDYQEAPSIMSDKDITKMYQHPDLSQELSCLSKYNRLLLEHIEIFRNPTTFNHPKNRFHIIEGRLGIRCRHCWKHNPCYRMYPSSSINLAKSMSNITNRHLLDQCTKIPKDVKGDLIRAKETNRKRYQPGTIALCAFLKKLCHLHDIVETDSDGLRLACDPMNPQEEEEEEEDNEILTKGHAKVEAVSSSETVTTAKRESGQDPQGRHPMEPTGKRLCLSHHTSEPRGIE